MGVDKEKKLSSGNADFSTFSFLNLELEDNKGLKVFFVCLFVCFFFQLGIILVWVVIKTITLHGILKIHLQSKVIGKIQDDNQGMYLEREKKKVQKGVILRSSEKEMMLQKHIGNA